MNKIWLSQYPDTVPALIDMAPYPSLVHMVDMALERHAPRPALGGMGKSTSYGELDYMSACFAAWLQARGVAKGDRVALMMPNVMPFAVSVLGVLRAGAAVVTVNPLYTPRELAHQLKDSGAGTIVILDTFTATLESVLADTPLGNIVVVPSGMVPPGSYELAGHIEFADVLQAGAAAPRQPVDIGPDDLAFLQYTGGTTGVSKGARLLHRNVLANLLQMDAWTAPALGATPAERAGLNIVSMLPLYHILALTCGLLFGIRNGMHNHLIANPRDLSATIRQLAGIPIHYFPAVNTLFTGLLAHPEFKQLELSQLRLCVGGGMAVHQAVAERWMAATGVPIIEGYGLSETSPVASCNLVTARAWTGTIGLPLPGTEIVMRDDAGRDVIIGEPGEICIRGPQVMDGYWQRPEETAKVMTPDGFFKSGDVGVMDHHGFVKIVDRKKDMILVSGFNVFPNEIEGVVAMLPGVLEVAAIGVPDERSGEAVKVFVVTSDPALSEAAVAEHCRRNLTAYKCPKHIEFRDALPKSTVGKVLRRDLRP
ncbi:AMP-binding protein [Cupriavidus necator]|uniref:AMP-binding protein n=1 Tax=Cupriavidus necator TaxID=106590 RepID=UPI003ECFE0D2